jgi:uncharacterized repeat protein (TIGR01451 family)
VADPGAVCLFGVVQPWVGGNFGDLVTIPAGKKITYTVVATIDAVTGGNLTNTVSVSTAPSPVVDLVLGNNTAIDVDVAPTADLVVTMTDGVLVYTPGGTVIYTIIVSNLGPQDVVGAAFSDAKPADFVTWTWKCEPQLTAVCNPLVETGVLAGFSDSITIPAGKSITYTVTGHVNPAATLPISNSAIVTLPLPAIFLDPVPGNNTVADTDTKAP